MFFHFRDSIDEQLKKYGLLGTSHAATPEEAQVGMSTYLKKGQKYIASEDRHIYYIYYSLVGDLDVFVVKCQYNGKNYFVATLGKFRLEQNLNAYIREKSQVEKEYQEAKFRYYRECDELREAGLRDLSMHQTPRPWSGKYAWDHYQPPSLYMYRSNEIDDRFKKVEKDYYESLYRVERNFCGIQRFLTDSRLNYLHLTETEINRLDKYWKEK